MARDAWQYKPVLVSQFNSGLARANWKEHMPI